MSGAAGAEITDVSARPFRAELSSSFEIAGGAAHEHAGVFVRLTLADGTVGHGEDSPLPAFNGETAEGALAAVRRAGRSWLGRDGAAWRPRLEELEESLPKGAGAARAALGMALLDAWTRRAGVPLRSLFGGAESRVVSDVTVTILPPEAAAAAARRIRALGVRTVKIKVGKDPDSDAERVAAVAAVDPRFTLMLDANQGYGPRESLRLLRLLRKRGLRVAQFEQPAAADDWDGLARVSRLGGVPVAADESVRGRADALGLSRRKCVSILNLKLMKMGLLEAWDCALIARAGGLGLMIGGMIETSLAMACAAHFAAGIGGFGVVDLDTPLWLKRDPTRGLRLARGGVYDLSVVRRGIDALGQAAGDDEAESGKVPGEGEGVVPSLLAGTAAADDGELRGAEAAGVAVHVQGEGAVAQAAQQGRKARSREWQQAVPGVVQPGAFGHGRRRARVAQLFADARRHAPGGERRIRSREQRRGASAALQGRLQQRRRESGRAREHHPGENFSVRGVGGDHDRMMPPACRAHDAAFASSMRRFAAPRGRVTFKGSRRSPSRG